MRKNHPLLSTWTRVDYTAFTQRKINVLGRLLLSLLLLNSHGIIRAGRISVYAFVRKMRRERPHMVRTFKQYVFIYECLLEYFQAGHTMADVTTLKKMYHDWTQTNGKTGS